MGATPMNVDRLIYSMLIENTGTHMLDSGGAYGRNWQRNQGISLQDFMDQPTAWPNWSENDDGTYDLWGWTVSTFHLLRNQLDLDELCNEFNAMLCEDWNGDYYGVSEAGQEWLDKHGFVSTGSENTYNNPDVWQQDQVIQYTMLQREPDNLSCNEYYVLIQIHGGCDVRGGYTDAKLFVLDNQYTYDGGYLDPGYVSAEIDGQSCYAESCYLWDSETCNRIELDLSHIKSAEFDCYVG